MTVSEQAVEAAAERAYLNNRAGEIPWKDIHEQHKQDWRHRAGSVLEAALPFLTACLLVGVQQTDVALALAALPLANVANGYDDELDDDSRLVGPHPLRYYRSLRSALRAASDAKLTLPAQPGSGVMRREDVAPSEADMRAFGASEAACYLWPEMTDEHEALRAAYIRGAADSKHTGQPVEGLRGDSKRGPSLEAISALLQEAVDWHDNQEAMADGFDCAESARYHEAERKKYQAAVAALSAAPASPNEVHERDTPVVKPIGQERS